MTKLILHIGLPKTGTTSIQYRLLSFNPQLRPLGINAIASEEIPAYHVLSHLLVERDGQNKKSNDWMTFEDLTEEKLWPKWTDGIHTQIMSQEDLFVLRGEGFNQLYDFAAQHELKVLLSVRDPLDWAYSLWKQTLKTSGNTDWLETLSKKLSGATLLTALQTWLERGRADAIRVFVVDPASGQDAFESFVRAADMQSVFNSLNPTPKLVANEGASEVESLYSGLFTRLVRKRLIQVGAATEDSRHDKFDRQLLTYNDKQHSFLRNYAQRMQLTRGEEIASLFDDSSHAAILHFLDLCIESADHLLTKYGADFDSSTMEAIRFFRDRADARKVDLPNFPRAGAIDALPIDSDLIAYVQDYSALTAEFLNRIEGYEKK